MIQQFPVVACTVSVYEDEGGVYCAENAVDTVGGNWSGMVEVGVAPAFGRLTVFDLDLWAVEPPDVPVAADAV